MAPDNHATAQEEAKTDGAANHRHGQYLRARGCLCVLVGRQGVPLGDRDPGSREKTEATANGGTSEIQELFDVAKHPTCI